MTQTPEERSPEAIERRRRLREENKQKLDACPAEMHRFRAPPAVPGVPNFATCTRCGGQVARSSALLYVSGVRTGMALACDLIQQVSQDIHDENEFALFDEDAPHGLKK